MASKRDTESFEDLADRRTFVLEPDQFDEFVALLDAEPEPNPKLQALFATPSRITRA